MSPPSRRSPRTNRNPSRRSPWSSPGICEGRSALWNPPPGSVRHSSAAKTAHPSPQFQRGRGRTLRNGSCPNGSTASPSACRPTWNRPPPSKRRWTSHRSPGHSGTPWQTPLPPGGTPGQKTPPGQRSWRIRPAFYHNARTPLSAGEALKPAPWYIPSAPIWRHSLSQNHGSRSNPLPS